MTSFAKKLIWTTILSGFLCHGSLLKAQSILYGFPQISAGVNGQIVSVDLVTCQETVISTITQTGNFTDFVMMPNGEIYLLGFSGFSPAVLLLDAPSGTWTVQTTLFGPPQNGGMLALSDSTILISILNTFYIYNINTNVATNIGGISGFSGFGEMFEYNGEIYITQSGGGSYPSGTYILDLNPVSLTQVTLPGSTSFPLTSVCNQVISASPVSEFNMTTGASNPLCNLNYGANSGFGSTAPNPQAATGPLCNCTTDAGEWSAGQPSSVFVCGPVDITLSHAGNEILDGNDNLVFVLTEGNILNNYPNNILAVFDNPVISFIPGITELNTDYYIYAIAANALAGGIDYNDPCRNINDFNILIQWLSEPGVTFTFLSQNCNTGCQTINANFSGSGPFTLSYNVSTNNGIINSVTQTFNNINAPITVCPPAAYSGPLTIQAVSVSNAGCTCD